MERPRNLTLQIKSGGFNMIKLVDVTEQNWLDVISLSVHEKQKEFLDKPIGIVARGYIYRSCNARVYGISNDEHIIGVALVKDMDEEPSCYDLQQFMIDRHFQNKGYGTEALCLILSVLSKERKYTLIFVGMFVSGAQMLKIWHFPTAPFVFRLYLKRFYSLHARRRGRQAVMGKLRQAKSLRQHTCPTIFKDFFYNGIICCQIITA